MNRKSENLEYRATQRIQTDARKLPTNICQLCSGMVKFGDNSIGIEQNDEIEEKLNFRICLNSTISRSVCLTCLTCSVFLLVA